MRSLPPTARRVFSALLVVVMLAVSLGTGVASAGGPSDGPGWPPDGDHLSVKLCNYTVVSGDTLFRIATRFHTTIWYLASVNGIHNVNYIRSGQHLFVPCMSPQPPVEFKCWYRIKAGDNLSRIALRFGTTTSALAAVNHIANPSRIYSGTWIRVPCTPHP